MPAPSRLAAILALAGCRDAGAFVVVPTAVGHPVPAPRASLPTMGLFDGLQAGFAKLQAGEYDEAEVKARVQNQIRMKPCVIYGMKSCGKSQETEKLLSRLGAVHTYIDFDEDEDGKAVQAELIGLGYSSFPAVFAGGKLLDDVVKMHANDQLESTLVSAGSLVPTQRI